MQGSFKPLDAHQPTKTIDPYGLASYGDRDTGDDSMAAHLRAVIIAAGLGSRMGPFGDSSPKCLLSIAGRSLFDRTVENLRAIGCDEIIVVKGHLGHMIYHPDVLSVENPDYTNNNILHSLMYARKFLRGSVIVSYSDIWVEPNIYTQLLNTPGDIVLAIDRDWQPYYEGRKWHPVSEAEKALVGTEGMVEKIGKHLNARDKTGATCGEFLGLWRMSEQGTAQFIEAFDDINSKLAPSDPFQRAPEWHRAYITDLLQHLVDNNIRVDSALIERGWAELDTVEDYLRLPTIAERQRLVTITNADLEL